MPSFASELEQSLHRALRYANERRHEYATLEHLLLAMCDDKDARAVLRACNVPARIVLPTRRGPFLSCYPNSERVKSAAARLCAYQLFSAASYARRMAPQPSSDTPSGR